MPHQRLELLLAALDQKPPARHQPACEVQPAPEQPTVAAEGQEHRGRLVHAGIDLARYGAQLDVIAPGAFLQLIVPLVVFFSLQRYFVQGITQSGLKG